MPARSRTRRRSRRSSAASARPIQRSGRTTGVVRGANERILDHRGRLQLPAFDTSAVVFISSHDAEHPANADRGIEQRRHRALAGLPDKQPQRDDDREQRDRASATSGSREECERKSGPCSDLLEDRREDFRIRRRPLGAAASSCCRSLIGAGRGRRAQRWARERRIVVSRVQRDAGEQQPEHDEQQERRNIAQPALQIRAAPPSAAATGPGSAVGRDR